MSLISGKQVEIIFYVQNMNTEVRFYRDVLGLKLRYPQGLKDYSDQMWVEFEVGNTLLALHGGASNQPNTLHEIVFWVENVAQAREMIIAAGVEMNEIRALEDGAPIAEGRDPDGHRFAIRSG
jgi:catechol 2,3-dioxygenase-like lactoylglutathione lyase family enzyme